MGVGTLVAVVAAVALLAVSGESGVWRIAVLVGFAVALGTLSAVLLSPVAARRLPPSRAVATASRERAQPAPSAAREPVYAHQGR
ncbi:hypothetical protein [Kitasatospora phosalacinea]|uniref:hypothetical protein n=1 Tax=Kitasatospora phosalacinea TaxID=2065 RepID=UPI0025526968|nr:hypothetical protein [Kitasatospora phosalacinea]